MSPAKLGPNGQPGFPESRIAASLLEPKFNDISDAQYKSFVNKWKNTDFRKADFALIGAVNRDMRAMILSNSIPRVDPMTTKGRIPHRTASMHRDIWDRAVKGATNLWDFAMSGGNNKKMVSYGEVGTKIVQPQLMKPVEMLRNDGNIKEDKNIFQRILDNILGR